MEEQKQDLEQVEKQIQEKPKITKIQEWLFRQYEFRNNTVTQTLEYRKLEDKNFVMMTDKIKTDIIIRLKEMRFAKPKEDLEDLLNSSLIEDHDPVKEYFQNLQFKGFGYIKKSRAPVPRLFGQSAHSGFADIPR